RAIIDSALLKELAEMANSDQLLRNNDGLKVKVGCDSVFIPGFWVLDSIHNKPLKKIFNAHGFPDYDLVGKSGSFHFWLLVQHQDDDTTFQKQVLIALEEKVKQSKASKSNYAYLYDRVMMNTNREQLYGTQMREDKNTGKMHPARLKEPKQVDERRKEVGLEPLEDYLKLFNGN
ncbi:MAG: DUF6624 domain-containing protein, partial [Bacteroidota bacterium]